MNNVELLFLRPGHGWTSTYEVPENHQPGYTFSGRRAMPEEERLQRISELFPMQLLPQDRPGKIMMALYDKNANPTQLVAKGYTPDNELPERKKDSLYRGYKPGGYACRLSVIQYDGREPSPSLFQRTHESHPPSAAFLRAMPPSARGVLGSPFYVLVYRFAKRPAINETLAVFSMERVHRQLDRGINMPIPEAMHEAFLTGVKPGLAEYMALTGKPYPLAELHSMIQSTDLLSLEQSSNPGNESALHDILDFHEAFKEI